MLTQDTVTRVGLLLLGGALLAGFLSILEKRFAEGGIYPHYASNRSDPMGTSVLYESLGQMEGLEVRRNLTFLNTVEGLDENTAILLLGYPRESFDLLRAPGDSKVMEAVEKGARLIITMNPELVPEVYQPLRSGEEDDWNEKRKKVRERASQSGQAGKEADEKEVKKEAEEEEKRKKEQEEEEARLEKEEVDLIGPLLRKKIDFTILPLSGYERPEDGWPVKVGKTLPGGKLPSRLPSWHSQFRFQVSESWKTVGMIETEPVVIERQYGAGSIVLTTDSYFVSNESLHKEANPEFLTWLIGGKNRVVFDETIHGSEESGGAMKLIRRYRAHGVFFGLFFFLVLWAWRSASSLVPGSDDRDRGLVSADGMVVGEGTGSGFIRLLRRSIPSRQLLEQCVAAWKGSLVTDLPEEKVGKVEQILAQHRETPSRFDLLSSYAAITELLRKR
ncbi:MAG: hypothetical protein KA250_09875 [Verrucomicrobiales bacterium]|nr:hypothetical protein [Verrucomicrobiales bacterium]